MRQLKASLASKIGHKSAGFTILWSTRNFPYMIFSAERVTFFLLNQVEHQKLNQTMSVLLTCWCSNSPSVNTCDKLKRFYRDQYTFVCKYGKTFEASNPNPFCKIFPPKQMYIKGGYFKQNTVRPPMRPGCCFCESISCFSDFFDYVGRFYL